MFKKDWIKLSADERISLMSDVVKTVYAKLSLVPIDFYKEIGVNNIQGIGVTYFFNEYTKKTPIGRYKDTQVYIIDGKIAIFNDGFSTKTDIDDNIHCICNSIDIDNLYLYYNWWSELNEWLIDDFDLIKERRENNKRLKQLFLDKQYLRIEGKSFYGGIDLSPIAKIYKITPNDIFSLFELTIRGRRVNVYNKMLIVSEKQLMLYYKNYCNEDVVEYYNIELCDEYDIEKEVKRQEKLFWETMKQDFGYDKKKKR